VNLNQACTFDTNTIGNRDPIWPRMSDSDHDRTPDMGGGSGPWVGLLISSLPAGAILLVSIKKRIG
jgi:hypothetical protein